MVNPFELMEKFPLKRTWKDKLFTAVFYLGIIAILGLAGYGAYTLVVRLIM